MIRGTLVGLEGVGTGRVLERTNEREGEGEGEGLMSFLRPAACKNKSLGSLAPAEEYVGRWSSA